MGDHRLVGGDQRLAGLDRGPRTGQRRAVRPANQFDHHIDIVTLAQDDHVVFPGIARNIDPAVLVPVTRADRGNHDRTAGAAGNQRGVGLDQPDNSGADRPKPGKGDPQRLAGNRRGKKWLWHNAPCRAAP